MKPITPITWVHSLPQANNLIVSIDWDNLIYTCRLSWQLLNITEIPAVTHFDEDGVTVIVDTPASETRYLVYSGNETITGTDYTNWNGNNDYPFTFVAGIIGVTLS